MSDFSNSCSTCNTAPCSCSSSCSPVKQCGPSTCKPNCAPNSCCAEVIPSAPLPYYTGSSMCPEDHCQTVIKAAYAASVKVQNSFNMPACGMSAQLSISGLISITVGAYLWNPGIGYLQVVAFDAYTGIATVQNNCNVGNVAVGTTIVACTLFVVTDPPVGGSGSSPTGIFVAIDFTAPNVGSCILITVTGVTGLSVGKNVQIGSGTYRIQAIPSATTIEICNDGAGITPGSPVIAKNGAGEYQYPLVLIDVNPCTNSAATPGSILACKDNIVQPLDGSGSVIGAVPRLIDPANNLAEWQALEIPTRTCTAITCCLTIVAGFAGPYIVPVADSSQFTVGDILQIGTRTDRFTVTAIPDATTLQGTLDPVPGATADIAPGTSICIIDCCEDLQNQLDDVIADIQSGCGIALSTQAFVAQVDTMPVVITQVTAGTPQWIGDTATLVITNPSDCKNMVAHVNLNVRIFGTVPNGGGVGVLQFKAVFDIGGPVDTVGLRKIIPATVGDLPYDVQLLWSMVLVLTPLQVITVNLHPQIDWDQGAGVVYNLGPPRSGSALITATGTFV